MADNIDRAQQQSAMWIQSKLEAHARTRQARNQEAALECDECGKLIPQARREAVPGCRLCVACQSKLEGGE